jgi:hypothetical protein
MWLEPLCWRNLVYNRGPDLKKGSGRGPGRLRLVGIALAVFAGLLLVSGSAQAQISPGPLAKAHESLNGATQCASCHEFGTKTPTFKCLECHKEIAKSLSANTGYHAQIGIKNPNGKDCIRCHLEHNGVDFALVQGNPRRSNSITSSRAIPWSTSTPMSPARNATRPRT